MRTAKLMVPLMALFCALLCSAAFATTLKIIATPKLGVPYSLAYIARHSPQSLKQGLFDSKVTFYESGATPTVYRTYDWSVTFEQNGYGAYNFYTNDSYGNWRTSSVYEEFWLGETVNPAPGTYTVRIQNVSGLGGTYESWVDFTDANGQGNSVWSGDVSTGQHDIVLPNVYVDGVNEINIHVNKTQF